MADRRVYGIPEDNFLVQHGLAGSLYDNVPAVQVEIGTEKCGTMHAFHDADFLVRLGNALIRAGAALAARQRDARHGEGQPRTDANGVPYAPR